MIAKEQKHLVSMDAIVLSEEDMVLYGDLYNIKTAQDYSKFGYEDFELSVQGRKSTSAKDFYEENGVYSFTATVDTKTVYYVAVPYDKGFFATVNGKEAPVIKVNNGFIGIVMDAGCNDVLLTYYQQGLNVGIVISCASIALFVGYLIFNRRKKNV